MNYILAPEWSHLGLASAAAFILGYALCWSMDKLFLRKLVDDRIAGIALSCGLAFVVIMVLASVGLTWFVRSQPYIAGRPIVIPPFPYALSLIFGLAVVGVIRTILYGREYEEGDEELVFDPDIYDQAQYDEEVLAWDEKHGHKNYFQRHWAGHLSLPVSYWVNNALLSALIAAGVEYAAHRIRESGGSLSGLAMIALGYLAFSVLFWVWSSVGIWRSAYWHRRRGGTPGWGLAARTLVVLSAVAILFRSGDIALQTAELGTLAAGRDSIGAIAEMKVSPDGRELAVRGNLANGAAARFGTLLAASPAVRTVVLTSPGGRMLEAERMAALIRDRRLDTRVDQYCMSACTSLLLAGRERTAPEQARIGFHQPSFPGMDAYEMGDAIERTRAEYLAAGVDSGFVARALATPAQSMWFPEPDQLIEAKVLTGSDVFVTTRGGERRRETLTEMRLRRQLQAIAAQINARGAVRVNDITTMERASVSGTTLTEHYKIESANLDVAGSRANLTRSYRQEICSNVQTALMVRDGARFVLSYEDGRGRPVLDVRIEKCTA
ncbi:MAG TPA: hypothetical protein VD846_01880 [Allosphingosinicella sp.]|nr:hypothetical protein [Allosphingosinicella sp.]